MRYVFGSGPAWCCRSGRCGSISRGARGRSTRQTHQWFVHELQFAIGPSF